MSSIAKVALLVLCAHSLCGGVVLDGSFGTHGALPGPNFMITAPMGRLVNTNLFQSFSQFNLISSQSATFSGPQTVHNVLARVTSGSASSIDGLVRSDIAGANLFLLNPSGVMFGPHAQLDVSGSFAVSTANYLKLADGGKFNTSLGGGDVLTSAPVSAFGFLNAPAGVSITGSNTFDVNSGGIVPGPGLNVASGKSLSVVAGNIAINGGYISGKGSRVNLISVGSAGEAKLDPTDFNTAVDVTQFRAMGDIDLTKFALIDMSGPTGGPVLVRGGNLLLESSGIVSHSTGDFQGGAIDIATSDSVKIINPFFVPVVNAAGGDINVTAKSVTLDISIIQSFTDSSASSGAITILTDNLQVTLSLIQADTFGIGKAGDISVTARSITLDGSTIFSSSEAMGASGNAGIVNLVTDSLQMISSAINTYTDGTGKGGDINVTAKSVALDDLSVIDSSTGFLDKNTLVAGNVGGVTLVADHLQLTNGSNIRSGTLGSGDAGVVSVNVTGALTISSGGLIDTSTFSSGKGGYVSVHAGSLSIDGSASFPFPGLLTGIQSSAEYGTGDAGSVTVTVDQALNLVGGGIIGAITGSSGKGGDITVNAGSIFIDKGGFITASTLSGGKGGDVTVNTGSIFIDAGQLPDSTGIFAEASEGTGNGGTVAVNAESVLLQNGGAISAKSFTSGMAGSVRLDVGVLSLESGGIVSSANTSDGPAGSVTIQTTGAIKLSGASSISTSADLGDAGSIELSSGGVIRLRDGSGITASAGANGGNIHITAPDLVYLTDSSITATAGTTGRSGSGGNITIDPQFIILKNSSISANAAAGQGGNINLVSDFFFNSGSLITATGTTNGTVNISAPELDLGAELITLATSLLSAENQLQERCTALLRGDFSSFISIGRGGTEPEPDELQVEF